MTVKTFMHLTLLLTESNKILKSEFELTLLNYSKIKKTKLISLFAKSVLFFMYQRDLIMRLFFVIKSLQSRIKLIIKGKHTFRQEVPFSADLCRIIICDIVGLSAFVIFSYDSDRYML